MFLWITAKLTGTMEKSKTVLESPVFIPHQTPGQWKKINSCIKAGWVRSPNIEKVEVLTWGRTSHWRCFDVKRWCLTPLYYHGKWCMHSFIAAVNAGKWKASNFQPHKPTKYYYSCMLKPKYCFTDASLSHRT
jgi:hypothetical protein